MTLPYALGEKSTYRAQIYCQFFSIDYIGSHWLPLALFAGSPPQRAIRFLIILYYKSRRAPVDSGSASQDREHPRPQASIGLIERSIGGIIQARCAG